jgi:hypothetical protein
MRPDISTNDVGLLYLVGCSGTSNNKSDSNSPSSSDTSASIDQSAPDENPTDQYTPKNLAPIPEIVQTIVNGVHQKNSKCRN